MRTLIEFSALADPGATRMVGLAAHPERVERSRKKPVIDCHSDVMIDVFRRRRAGQRAVLAQLYLPSFAEGGVVASVCTVGGDFSALCPLGIDEPYQSTLAMLDELYADVAESDGRVAVVGSASELVACVKGGVFAILPALEGASPFQGELELVEDLYERGVRVVGLTWNTRNELAVGVNTGEGGLTDLGARAVELMNDLGVVIDLAHASPSTFWDVVGVTTAPVYASHANAKEIHDHPRNLDNDQLRAIATSGGAIGLVLCSLFVAPPPAKLNDVLAHLDYLRQAVGDQSIVIGADFLEFTTEELNADRRPHTNLYVGYDESARHPVGIETVRSLQNLIGAMAERGLDANAIDKIATGNFLRVLRQTQALAGVSNPAGSG